MYLSFDFKVHSHIVSHIVHSHIVSIEVENEFLYKHYFVITILKHIWKERSCVSILQTIRDTLSNEQF